MKSLKKLAVVLLALMMVMLLTVTAFAADATYSITINNGEAGHTYNAYQIFSGTLSGTGVVSGDPDTNDPYQLSYIQWGSGVRTDGLIAALKGTETFSSLGDTATAADVAEILSTANTAAAAQALADVLVGGGGTTYLSETPTASVNTQSNDNTQYVLGNLPAGYYLVTDAFTGSGTDHVISDYIVKVVADVTMEPKADKPSIEKKVYEESFFDTSSDWGSGYNDVADYDIGDAVPFKLVASIPDMTGYDGYDFVITDTLSAGLTLDADSIRVYVASAKDTGSPGEGLLTGEGADYTLNTSPEGGASFTITLEDMEDNGNLTGENDNYIIVTYTATLNEDAVIGLDGNPNKVKLTYSNNPNGTGTGTTPEDIVVVFTYALDGDKINGENEPLSGAQFVLLKQEGTDYYAAKVGSADSKLEGWVKVEGGDNGLPADVGDWTAENWAAFNADVILTSADTTGDFGVAGLDEGTYYLREIKAPGNYNLLPEDLTLVLAASTNDAVQNYNGTANSVLTGLTIKVDDGAVQNGNLETGAVSLDVVNESGSTLPETGGMGTALFYVIGGLLVAGAAILLIVRVRMKASGNE